MNARPDVRFREHMRGWMSFDHRDYNTALAVPRDQQFRCSCKVKVEVADIGAFLREPHTADLSGVVNCPPLGGRLTSEEGTFELFARAPDDQHRRIKYRLLLRDPDGRKLTLTGFKLLEDDPHYDVWRDTTRLLTRLLKGWVREEEAEDDSDVIAAGELRISAFRFLKTLWSMARWPIKPPLLYQRAFLQGLIDVYWGSRRAETQFDFPRAAGYGPPPEQDWHPLPGRPNLRRRIVGFSAKDFDGNLHNIRPKSKRAGSPVLLVSGLSMRANSFYGPPFQKTLVDALVKEGYDVWIENWRTSIDFAPRDYTLDEAAAFDHPAAVAKVREMTGCTDIDAVAHCMGSASLTMSVLAGKLELRTVVASAVSLHISVDPRSHRRLRLLVPVLSMVLPGTDSQWGARAPSLPAAQFGRFAAWRQHEYRNKLVAAATYVFGNSEDALWRRSNMTDAALDWVGREFGYAPFTLFKQMRKCADAGYLVPVHPDAGLPPDLRQLKPPAGTRFTFLAGTENRFFLPKGQKKTYDHFNAMEPGLHTWVPLEGYGHFDTLAGRNADKVVFPEILKALADGA